jgi:hypothetical protein
VVQMNQDDRFQQIVSVINETESLQQDFIPPELAKPSSFLKLLNASHHNWQSERFRKVFGMRFSVKLPPIEQLNVIIYPRTNYDLPVFIFFCMLTKRKVIAHLNVNCPFHDDHYNQEWVMPLAKILDNYPSFESRDRYPEWMHKYRNDCSIYGLFPIDRLDDISNCCFAYLDHYLSKVSSAKPTTDSSRLAVIRQFHDQWISDIRTQDKAQGMMAKMIGANTAKRIFHEVTT